MLFYILTEPGLSLLDSLLDIPPFHSWIQFFTWSKEHGPLYQLIQPMAAVLLSDNLRLLFLPYNDLWRRGRKLMHTLTMSSSSLPVLKDLIDQPQEYERVFERKMIVTVEEDVLKRIPRVVHTMARVASPGAYLVDTPPSLMNTSEFLSPFKKNAKKLHAEVDLYRGLQNHEKSGLSNDEGAYLVGTLFEAVSGTTAAAMMSFLLAMEVDSAVAEDRLPSFENIERLPRARAAVKETLRLGRTSMSTNRPPTDPEDFIPERWLDSKWPTFGEPLDIYPNLQHYSAFDFGRKICPGQNIAERSLNILVARIAWSCDVRGVDDWDYDGYRNTTVFNVRPERFQLRLNTRKGREDYQRSV
ncbi:cytochrome P450 [Rhexocercosporidium sp. MPI-PUGE-AT-0058]|nr:cytochrome P450 [Rhexocercosporidium sp. MPI-PUGE-AT-0058]